jgi:acyl-CoA synthetase (NDP forming)
VPGPGRVGVYAMSGGTASHVADLCGLHRVPVPKFEQATIDAVSAIVPWYLHIGNPLDSGGALTARPENRTVLELMLADPNVDILFAPITGVFPGMSDALAKDLIELHRIQPKPVITCWTSPIHDDPAYRSLCEAGVPLFHSFGAAVRGLAELGRYGTFTRSYRSPFDDVAREPTPGAHRARALLRPNRALDEVAAKELLSWYGIPTVAEHVVRSPAEAAQAARHLGLPVVMKILSAEILHKSDLGLVTVGVASEHDAELAYRDLVARAAVAVPGTAIDQVVVQAMVRDAVAEAILGISHQPPFGATVMYGLGGIFTEVFHDVSFGVPPFGEAHARAMIERTRGVALLRGARGRPPGDVEALVDAIVRLQLLALELGDDIAELDVNPMMVMPEGNGVVAVDALVIAR